jgi:hypothetical protein
VTLRLKVPNGAWNHGTARADASMVISSVRREARAWARDWRGGRRQRPHALPPPRIGAHDASGGDCVMRAERLASNGLAAERR